MPLSLASRAVSIRAAVAVHSPAGWKTTGSSRFLPPLFATARHAPMELGLAVARLLWLALGPARMTRLLLSGLVPEYMGG
eukprot:COSAG01_NODE_954_length_12493_cov_8.138454_7_plen_80_part_00